MNTDLIQKIDEMLKRQEGRVPHPYQDPLHKIWTMGYGRNIQANPLSEDEMCLLLANDRNRALSAVLEIVPIFEKLNLPRQCALISFCFNVGAGTFKLFKKFLLDIEYEKWTDAANEIRSALYTEQVPGRAHEIANIIETGQFQS